MNTTITFYDSDVLSSFLRIDRADLLKKFFKEIHVPKQVFEEITTPDSYWLTKRNANFLKRQGYIKIIPVESSYKSLKDYNDMVKGKYGRPIGKGEAAALSLALNHDGVIASNNLKDVKAIAQHNHIPLLTTSIILTALYEKGELTKKEVEKTWEKMKKRNTMLPKKKL